MIAIIAKISSGEEGGGGGGGGIKVFSFQCCSLEGRRKEGRRDIFHNNPLGRRGLTAVEERPGGPTVTLVSIRDNLI